MSWLYDCPQCGVIAHAEARQTEVDECCVEVCRTCGQVVHIAYCDCGQPATRTALVAWNIAAPTEESELLFCGECFDRLVAPRVMRTCDDCGISLAGEAEPLCGMCREKREARS